MVKTRLIPVLFIKNGLIVRSEDFSYHQNIGNVVNQTQRYNSWNVDELIYLDISRDPVYDLGRDDHKVDAYSSHEEIIKTISRECFMPLTLGGGIRTMENVDFLIRNGADKICINSAAHESPDLVRQTALKYGSQAVVLSIDYKVLNNTPIVFTKFGIVNTGLNVLDWIEEGAQLGAGEIFLNAIDRDGKASGYDLKTIGEVVEKTMLPVVACGGAGNEYDFLELAKETKVSGIAAGNWFHFVEGSYLRAKKMLKKNGVDVR